MPDPYNVSIDHTYLRFNPSSPKFYDEICADIPVFDEYREHKKPVLVRIFAWIVCMYDMNTPLRREIKDLYKRKVYAGTLTGLMPNKVSGKYKEFIEDIFVGQDEQVNKLIVAYIASFSSPEYKQLMGHLAIQDNTLNDIIKGDASRESQTMIDLSTETISRLTRLLYGSGEKDEVYEARRALYKQVAYDLSDMRPESIAKIMEVDGTLSPEWNPYDPEYKPGEIKFVGDDESIAVKDEE